MAELNAIAIELNAIDNATAVFTKVQGAVEKLSGAYDMLKSAAGALGVGLSAGAFASMIEGSIGSMNALYELSLKTGAAVETLSALRGVAKQSGTDMDAVATMTQKLSKSMFEFSDSATSKAAFAFKALGYTQAQVKAGMADMNTFLPEFAQRLMESGTATERVALAQELMGKAGANALPFMHQLAQAGELHGRITEEQAKQAHEFELQMVKLNAASLAFKNSIAIELLPTLVSWLTIFNQLKSAGGWLGFATTSGDETSDPLTKIKEYEASLRKMMQTRAEFDQMPGWKKWFSSEDIAILDVQIKAMTGKIDMLRKFYSNQIKDLGNLSEPPGGSGNPLDPTGKKTKELKEADPFESEVRRLQEVGVAQEHINLITQEYERIENGRFGWLSEAQKAELIRLAAIAQTKKDDAQFQKEWTEVEKKDAEERRSREMAEATRLNSLADHYKAMIDPLQAYRKELDDIDKLEEQGRLTADQALEARFKVNVAMEETNIKLNGVAQKTKETDNLMRDLGFTMASSFESAVAGGKHLSDVLKALGQDLMKIATRKAITEPLAKATTDALSKSGIGDIFKNMFGSAAAGPELLNSYASGTDYVPQTGPYLLHQGEAVVPANQNASGAGGGTVNLSVNINAVDARSVAQLFLQGDGQRIIVATMNQAMRKGGVSGAFAI